MSGHHPLSKIVSCRHITNNPRYDGHVASSSSWNASNSKYSLGNLLCSEGDIVHDNTVERILCLNEFNKCMVHQAGEKC